MRPLLIVLTLAVLAACAPAVAPTPGGASGSSASVTPQQLNAIGDDVEACRAVGGEVRPICMMGTRQCVVTFADAGRTCRDSDDCQGDCRIAAGTEAGRVMTGQCQASSNPCGCFATVEDGRAGPSLCAD